MSTCRDSSVVAMSLSRRASPTPVPSNPAATKTPMSLIPSSVRA